MALSRVKLTVGKLDVCYFTRDQPHLIVYPYMANGNLFDAIVNDKKKIPYSRRIVIALNLVLGLKHLHSKG